MSVEDVRTLILARMPFAYGPHPALRILPAGEDWEQARSNVERQYLEALAGFSPATLSKAWAKVRADTAASFGWPLPGKFVQACRMYENPTVMSEDGLKRARAADLADAYAARFRRTSKLARAAEEEGWLGRLLDYVSSAAWVQAQMIEGARPIGFSSVLIPDEATPANARDALDDYVRSLTKQITSGTIRVAVPKAKVERWKALAAEEPDVPSPPDCWRRALEEATKRKQPSGARSPG